MRRVIPILFVLLIALAAGQARAQDAQNCDFQRFKEDLGVRESSGDYGVVNDAGYMGKYQFGQAALTDLGYMTAGGGWTGKDGINSQQDFLNSPQVQESAMDQWTVQMNREIQAYGLEQYIGQNIGGCTVTRSGLMAGRHLVGIGNSDRHGLRHWLESGGTDNPVDGNGTQVSRYVCQFGGYQTPFDAGGGQCGGGMNYPGEPGIGRTPTNNPDIAITDEDHWDMLREAMLRLWVSSLMLFAEQMSATMISQVQMIGMMLDAKHQLETQRLFQEKMAQAHKDYHPSEQMCTFGTFSRGLLTSERYTDETKAVVAKKIMMRDTGEGPVTALNQASDKATRIKRFIAHFCNRRDNGEGLAPLCITSAPADMINKDINYTATVDEPNSLDINLVDNNVTDDERRVFALLDNLFAHDPMPRIKPQDLTSQKYQYQYYNMRSIMAIRGIARNSIAAIIAEKTGLPASANSSAPYMRSMLRDFGLSPEEITLYLGQNPSYYAQMELLTKKIYQTPAFYTNLYDKPVNVKRIRAAMQAIKLMQDRDIQDAFHRREMLLSMILELRLRERAEIVYSGTDGVLFEK